MGCKNCDCNLDGVIGGLRTCDKTTGQCPCKLYGTGRRCTRCKVGFYGLAGRKVFGCTGIENCYLLNVNCVMQSWLFEENVIAHEISSSHSGSMVLFLLHRLYAPLGHTSLHCPKHTPSPRPYVSRPFNLCQARAQMTITYPCTTDVMLRVWLWCGWCLWSVLWFQFRTVLMSP